MKTRNEKRKRATRNEKCEMRKRKRNEHRTAQGWTQKVRRKGGKEVAIVESVLLWPEFALRLRSVRSGDHLSQRHPSPSYDGHVSSMAIDVDVDVDGPQIVAAFMTDSDSDSGSGSRTFPPKTESENETETEAEAVAEAVAPPQRFSCHFPPHSN